MRGMVSDGPSAAHGSQPSISIIKTMDKTKERKPPWAAGPWPSGGSYCVVVLNLPGGMVCKIAQALIN